MAVTRSFEQIYQIAPESAVRRLLAFREHHAARNIEKEGMIYRVWDVGRGGRAAVFLPSGMGHGEIWFPFLSTLGADIRCIAISLPECTTMEQYARQIHSILQDDLGIKEVVMIGQAIGGLLAQVYLRLYPGEVIGQILALTGAPCRALPSDLRARWADRKKLIWRYSLSPFEPMRQTMGYKTYENLCPEEYQDAMTFWRAFISETYEYYVYKKQYINLNCKALPDLYARCPFDPSDMCNWSGKTLIMESDGDQYYGEQERKLLCELYPRPKVISLGSVGQFALMLHEQQAIVHMREFLRAL